MSLTQIKDEIATLGIEDRLDLLALIHRLNQADDPNYKTELGRRLDDMATGHKTNLKDLERLHEKLTASGR